MCLFIIGIFDGKYRNWGLGNVEIGVLFGIGFIKN